MKKRLLFIDRDGTLIEEPADEQIDSFEKLKFVKGVFRNLAFIREKLDFEFVMVSNQDGLAPNPSQKRLSGQYTISFCKLWKAKESHSTRSSLIHISLKTMRLPVSPTRDWWRNTLIIPTTTSPTHTL